MARYDVPAAIDKSLELNGAISLYYIGHSQGTLVGFLTLAENPMYNSKVSNVEIVHWADSVTRNDDLWGIWKLYEFR